MAATAFRMQPRKTLLKQLGALKPARQRPIVYPAASGFDRLGGGLPA